MTLQLPTGARFAKPSEDDALPYEYEHLQHWVAPAAQHERGAARGPGQENRTGLESL